MATEHRIALDPGLPYIPASCQHRARLPVPRPLATSCRWGLVGACGALCMLLATTASPANRLNRHVDPFVGAAPSLRAGATAVALTVAASGGAAHAAPFDPFLARTVPVEASRLPTSQVAELTRYLAPEVAENAPPLKAGENYNPEFDADYEAGDSFENILGLVVKLLLFAPILAFLGFFLYGFIANSEEVIDEETGKLAPRAPNTIPTPPTTLGSPEVAAAVVPVVLSEGPPEATATVAADSAPLAPGEPIALYFRPIPEGVGYAELRRLFASFGAVDCLSLRDDHGFVWMPEPAAEDAIRVLHGGEFRHTRLVVRKADTNKLPAAQRQVILRQSQIASEKMEKIQNRSVHYFRCLAVTARRAAKTVAGANAPAGEAKSKYQKALENMAATLEDIALHHVVDTVESRSTAQVGLDELVRLAGALLDAATDADRQQTAARILECVEKYAGMEVIPHPTKQNESSAVALYFRPVPFGVDASVYAELFNRYGEVEAIQLKDRYGFVWMEEAGARAALELLQGYRVPGGKLFVNVAKTSALTKSDKAKATSFGGRAPARDTSRQMVAASVAGGTADSPRVP